MRISPDLMASQDMDPDGAVSPFHARGIEQTQSPRSNFEDLAPPRLPEAPRSALIQIIEGEIIPRLFLAHCDQSRQRPDDWGVDVDALLDCRVLAGFFLRGDSADILSRFQVLMDRGMRREEIYLEFLACVPRTLSLFWEEGLCRFEDMACGLACLDEVLHKMHESENTASD